MELNTYLLIIIVIQLGVMFWQLERIVITIVVAVREIQKAMGYSNPNNK